MTVEHGKREFPIVVVVIVLTIILDQVHELFHQDSPTLVNWFWFVDDLNYPEWYVINTTRIIKQVMFCWLVYRFARLYEDNWTASVCFALLLMEIKELWDYWGYQNSWSSVPEIIGFTVIIITSLIYYRVLKKEDV